MHLAVLGAFKKIPDDDQKICSRKLKIIIIIIRNYVTVGLKAQKQIA